MTTGRRPIEIVEIDLPHCTRTFGVYPCAASLDARQDRTNLALWSEQIDNAYYTKLQITVGANATVAPDGLTTAELITDTAVSSIHRISRSFTYTAGQPYTYSMFFKAGTLSNVVMVFPAAPFTTSVRAQFDLAAGAVVGTPTGTPSGYGIVAIPNRPGWYRCWISKTATAGGAGAIEARLNAGGSDTYTGTLQNLSYWGIQVEVGATMSGYKPTTSATVTASHGGALAKCYKSRATCEDPANYDAGILTVRFGENVTGLPQGQNIFPALKSVSSRPAEINVSGIDPNKNSMGKRARVTVTLQDFAKDPDTFFDPYQSDRVSGAAMASGIGFNPADRGTVLGKLLARYPYYVGIPLRHLRGYVGDALASMEASHYVIAELTGPNAGGGVSITAKDIFDLVENKKSTLPIASRGKLTAAITIGASSATLKPTGIGDLEYPSSGRVCIGREIATFTRSGDVLTLTNRGVDGSVAAAHAVNDVVQVCARFENMRASDIISAILLGGGVPSANISLATWNAEEDAWLGGMRLTATIPKPTGRATLIGEVCQHGVMVWPDVTGNAIRFRANRPLAPGETFFPVTDAANIIQGTPTIDRADDLRASRVWLFHGMIDPTDTATDSKNFDKLADAAVDEDLYQQESIKVIYSRWFGQYGDDAAASVIAERLLARYRNTPKVIGLTLDIKDRAGVDLGSLLAVTSYLLQDKDGQTAQEPMQVNMIEVKGDRIKIEAETYSITGRFGFWMQDPQADYDTATDDEKQTGAFWMDDTIGVFPDGTGPYIYF